MTCFPLDDKTHLLVSKYSAPGTSRVGIVQFLIRNLRARRGIDGPQIILNWDEPEDTTSLTLIRIQRKIYSFPLNEADGITVFEGAISTLSFADCEDVPEKKCLYYKVFTYNSVRDEWISAISTQINIVAFFTGDDHWRRFFTAMGENIIVLDKDIEHRGASKFALEKVFADDGECFNIHEVGERKGQLARFYKLAGALTDEAKQLICDMRNQRNVNETCFQHLNLIASLLGFEINSEIPIKRQRLEIKNRVEILKIKGTLPSIEAIVQSITGFNTDIKEWVNNIFIANKSSTPGINPEDWLNQGTSLDNNYYLIDKPNGPRACNTISIIIDLKSSKSCLSPGTISKVSRALKEVMPLCTFADILWKDEIYLEDYDDAEETDQFSEVETFNAEESPWAGCWFTANDPVQGIANSQFVTPIPGGSCGEVSFDVIEIATLISKYSPNTTGSPP